MSTKVNGKPVVLDHNGELQAFLTDRLAPCDYPFASQVWREPDGAQSRANTFNAMSSLPPVPDCRLHETLLPVVGATRYGRSLQVMHVDQAKEVFADAWGIAGYTGVEAPKAESSYHVDVTVHVGAGHDVKMFLADVIELGGNPWGRELFLLCMVDFRWMMRQTCVTLEPVKSSETTWQMLIDDLAEKSGYSITAETPIESDFLYPDPGFFNCKELNAAQCVDLIADSLGRRAIVEGNGIVLQTPEEGKDELDAVLAANFGDILRGGHSSGCPVPNVWKLQCQDALDHRALPGETQSAEVELSDTVTMPWDSKKVSVASTYVLERFNPTPSGDPAEDDGSRDRADALITVLGQTVVKWFDRSYRLETTVSPTEPNTLFLLQSGTIDYLSWRYDGSGPEPAAFVRVVGMPPDIFPRVNLSQSRDLCLFPHDVAQMEQASPGTIAKIKPLADWGYDGPSEDLNVRDIGLGDPEEPREFVAYFHFEEGWKEITTEDDAGLYLYYFTALEDFGYTNADSVNGRRDEVINGTTPDGFPGETNEVSNGTAENHRIFDPLGLFKDTAKDAKGIAFWNETKGRSEILLIQRPHDRMRVRVTTDLWGDDADVSIDSQTSLHINPYAFGQDPSQAENPLGLDAPELTYVWVRRNNNDVNNGLYWDVIATENHYARHVYGTFEYDATSPDGPTFSVTADKAIDGDMPDSPFDVDMTEIPLFARPRADHIGDWKAIFRLDPSDGTYWFEAMTSWVARWAAGSVTVPAGDTGQNLSLVHDNHWDGFRPDSAVDLAFRSLPRSQCDQDVTYTVVASYDREDNKYLVIATESAWMGAPKQVQMITGPMTKDEENTEEGKTCYTQNIENVMVFDCGDEGPLPIQTLCLTADDIFGPYDPGGGGGLGLCKWICENCEQFSKPDGGCDSEPCSGECTWTWDRQSQVWELESQCTGGTDCGCGEPPDPPAEPSNEQDPIVTPCIDYPPPPPPCGSCTWTWSGTVFENPVNNCTDELGTLCECGDPPDPSEGAGMTPGDTLDVDCVEPPKPCTCNDCAFGDGGQGNLDGVITGAEGEYYIGDPGGSEKWVQSGASQHTPGSGYGYCHWYVPMEPEGGGAESGADVIYNGNGSWDIFHLENFTVNGNCTGGAGEGDTPESNWIHGADGENCQTLTGLIRRAKTCGQTARKLREAGKLGQAFVKSNPQFFKGCNCMGDVGYIMDRWTPESLTPNRILRVTETVLNKNPELDVEAFAQAIYDYFIGGKHE